MPKRQSLPLTHVPSDEALLAHRWTLDDLLHGARERKDAHIGELTRRFGDRLFAHLYRSDPQLAGEIVTDTFMALPEYLRGYQELGRFEPWLHQVALNMLRSRRRAARDRHVTLDSDIAESGASRAERTADQLDTVNVMLSRLDERERRIWCLLEDGHTPAEVAGFFGITENNVYQIRHRAKKKLREAAAELR